MPKLISNTERKAIVKSIPQPYKIFIWTALGVGGLLFTLHTLNGILLPFIAGSIGAYVLNRPARCLEHLNFSRGVASAILILAVIIILALVGLIALPYLQQELLLFAQSVPKLAERALTFLTPLFDKTSQNIEAHDIDELKTQLTNQVGVVLKWSIDVLINILGNGMALANLLSLIVLTPIIMFYLLKDWQKLIDHIDQYLPKSYANTIRKNAKIIDTTLAAYARGQAIVCLILMCLYAVSLWSLGLKQGIFIGILTGFLSFIPYIGMLVGFTVSMGVSFSQFSEWSSIGSVSLVFVIIPLIEANFLTPRFIGDKIGLHPVWIIFALLSGGTLFGFVGILLALPIAATLGVLIRILMDWYLSSSFYLSKR